MWAPRGSRSRAKIPTSQATIGGLSGSVTPMMITSVLAVFALANGAPPVYPVAFLSSYEEWAAVTSGDVLKVTFEEPFWPVDQILTGAWTLNGFTFQGFAGTPGPNIYVANFDPPFGSPQWLTANGDEDINVTPTVPLTALAFDAQSDNLGAAFVKVFDTGNNLIGSLTLPARTVRFVGIISGTPIGHVNFSSTLGALQDTGIDNVRIAFFSPTGSPDLNGDGHVDGADLGLVIANWATPGLGDLNFDGTVDGADLGLIIGGWTG